MTREKERKRLRAGYGVAEYEERVKTVRFINSISLTHCHKASQLVFSFHFQDANRFFRLLDP